MMIARSPFARFSVIASLGVALIGCTRAPLDSVRQSIEDAAPPKQLQSRQIIVTLAQAPPEHWTAIAERLRDEYRLREVGSFPLGSIRVQCIVFQIAEEQSLPQVMIRLSADPRIDSVQSNQVFHGFEAPRTVGLLDARRFAYGAWAIRADSAHQFSTGKGITIALVDTGVDTAHPALRGRITSTANFVEHGERSFATDRHGTAVAGVMVARATDGFGTLGIAPQSSVAALKACWHPSTGGSKALCSSWTIARAVDYAITRAVDVLNLSLSGPADPLLTRLLLAAHAQGVTIVAAAAEGDRGPGFPASLDPVIAVVPSDINGRIQARTGAGLSRVAAPGVDVLSTVPHKAYDFLSGSSLAAAHVSGVVALLLEQEPRLAPSEVAKILKATVQRAPSEIPTATDGVGIVDACGALSALMGRAVCPARSDRR